MVAAPVHIASGNAVSSPWTLTGAASGDLLLLVSRDGVGTSEISTSVTDNLGGTWTLLDSAPATGTTTGRRVELWTKLDSATITGVTITYTGTTALHAALLRIDGAADTSPVGPHTAITQASTATPAEVKLTVTEANMLVISMFQANSNTQAQHVHESGWTRGTTGANGPAWAYRTDLAANANDGCAWTVSTAAGNGTAMVAIRSAPSAPAGPGVTVWNGTAEVAVSAVTVWDGSAEQPASLSTIA